MSEFQQLMRRWTELAPYNAGHILRVSGPPDVERWRAGLDSVAATIGLKGSIPIELSRSRLDERITQELNCPFAAGALPLRAFVLSDGGDSHLLGVIYDHWFADSPSLRAFMQRVFAHYSGSGEDLPALRRATDDDAFATSGFTWQLRALVSCVGNYRRHRLTYRIHLRDPLDLRAGFFTTRFPDGAINRIRAFAKQNRATVNDVFVAAASEVLGKFTAAERSGKRDRIAIAAAVDLKPLSAKNLGAVFGSFVSYFTVLHANPEARPLSELLAATAHETSANKRTARALQFTWSLRIARWLWDLSSRPRFKVQLFQKGLPLLAGISNVNLTGSWADRPADAADSRGSVLDYLRISPVGPLLPLVFTLTTIGDRLSLCVTYRTTAFSHAQAEQLASALIETLRV